ncbi:hypothetical protein [Mycobacterium shimoidei]|uniref:Uncharacterized protein n=1 Tax=Mycobacterium shimoidei TaxID=29313 RepID=A0A375YU37_MYCSH|nr:hypothetical protein [Mycobacterium shimoidei]MCV7257765.1 hypothetical protein [Mycobacterium shimoidei]SRX92339.1 hypothetical protein MSP7336_00564 [Mycobacterium shimoidei]
MTEPHLRSAPADQRTLEPVSAPPALITEQELALGTAAAQGVQPDKVRWWTSVKLGVAAAFRDISVAAKTTSQPKRQFPRRYGFLEDALMAREMDRL